MIKKIFHTGDWHLRNYDRHSEFLETIDLFLGEVISDNLPYDEGLIVIAGDLFETQEFVSNEANTIMIGVIQRCLKIHPTLIIIGNHDLPRNRTRMDAITPIVNAIDNPNLKYSKYSESFTINGVVFVHYSFLDNFAVQIQNKINDVPHIGLYHAPLQNCKNPLNYVFEKKMQEHKTNVSLFNGCDCVLMGDIHYPQTIKGNGFNAYYCGSLYQQNFGELVEKHGFGILEVSNLSYIFVELNNSYGKYKLKISSIEDIDENNLNFTNISI